MHRTLAGRSTPWHCALASWRRAPRISPGAGWRRGTSPPVPLARNSPRVPRRGAPVTHGQVRGVRGRDGGPMGGPGDARHRRARHDHRHPHCWSRVGCSSEHRQGHPPLQPAVRAVGDFPPNQLWHRSRGAPRASVWSPHCCARRRTLFFAVASGRAAAARVSSWLCTAAPHCAGSLTHPYGTRCEPRNAVQRCARSAFPSVPPCTPRATHHPRPRASSSRSGVRRHGRLPAHCTAPASRTPLPFSLAFLRRPLRALV